MLFALSTLAFLLPLAMAAPGGSSMGGVYLVRPSSSSSQLSWQHNIIVKEYHWITSNGAVFPSLYPRFHCLQHFADEQERWWLRLCILFWWTNWWDPISGAAICSQHFIESAPFWLRMGPIQWNLSWCWYLQRCARWLLQWLWCFRLRPWPRKSGLTRSALWVLFDMMFQVDYSVDYRADYGGGIGNHQPHERQVATSSFYEVFYNQDHDDYQNNFYWESWFSVRFCTFC